MGNIWRALFAISSLWGQGHTSDTPVSWNTDQEVVEGALLAFYDDFPGRFSDWSKGDFIVLRPKWRIEERPKFDQILEVWKDWGKDERPVDRVKAESQIIYGEPFRGPKTPTPIDSMKLDDRIVVTNKPIDWRLANPIVANVKGFQGAVRLEVSLSPPCYSLNGEYAFLYMVPAMPRSGGSAMTYYGMFLKRAEVGWKREFAVFSFSN